MVRIEIKVVAYGEIRKYLNGRSEEVIEAELDFTVRDLLQVLKKPEKEVWMVNVNGLLVNERHKLKDGDEVRIFEPVGGG